MHFDATPAAAALSPSSSKPFPLLFPKMRKLWPCFDTVDTLCFAPCRLPLLLLEIRFPFHYRLHHGTHTEPQFHFLWVHLFFLWKLLLLPSSLLLYVLKCSQYSRKILRFMQDWFENPKDKTISLFFWESVESTDEILLPSQMSPSSSSFSYCAFLVACLVGTGWKMECEKSYIEIKERKTFFIDQHFTTWIEYPKRTWGKMFSLPLAAVIIGCFLME